jgi:hypothetical protein
MAGWPDLYSSRGIPPRVMRYSAESAYHDLGTSRGARRLRQAGQALRERAMVAEDGFKAGPRIDAPPPRPTETAADGKQRLLTPLIFPDPFDFPRFRATNSTDTRVRGQPRVDHRRGAVGNRARSGRRRDRGGASISDRALATNPVRSLRDHAMDAESSRARVLVFESSGERVARSLGDRTRHCAPTMSDGCRAAP